jgi:hypothetical protein
MKKDGCHGCGKKLVAHDTVYLAEERKPHSHSERRKSHPYCAKCFNEQIAALTGLEFEHTEFRPVVMKDADGNPHEFHFRGWLTGGGYSIEGFELKDGHPAGYQFRVLGDPEGDSLELWGRLFERMRRELARKHLQVTDLGLQIKDERPWEVRALINSDLETDSLGADTLPLLVIDGREITWEEFGKMIMTFEGFRFRMELYDQSEER